MATRKFFLRKIKDIRHKYGESAVQYFIENHKCEDCGDDKLVVLNIHHVHGKKVEEFKTLCHNCHVIEHNQHIKDYTYQTYLDEINQEKLEFSSKKEKILDRLNDNMSIRKIINIENTCLKTVKEVMDENNFVSIPRKGYKKILV